VVDYRAMIRSRALLAGLFCVFLGAIDLTVIASTLATMIPDLGVNSADVDRYIWVVNGYLIAYVVAIPLVGRLSDAFGRKTMFLACLALFALGSMLCATAGTLDSLVLGRTIQGFGGGGLLPVTIALAGDVLPRAMRLAGIGLVSAVDTLGWVLGPTWGAAVVALFPASGEPWRWIFWLNIPLLLIALAAVWRGLPRAGHKPSRTSSNLDLPGSVLLATALVAANLALASGGEIGAQAGGGLRAFGGTSNPLADVAPYLLGLAALATIALVWWERRARAPILPVNLLRRPHFVAMMAANFLIGSALMVGMVDVPVIVALVGSSESISARSALLLAPLTLAIAAGALASGPIAGRIGTFALAISGSILTAGGYGMVTVILNAEALWRMGIGLAVAGLGIGLLLAPLSAVALDASDSENRGAAVSMALMFRLLGMTIGMSLLTAAGVHRLQVLTGRLDPVVQAAGETTAAYLARQQQFVQDHVVPLSIQVMQETFLAAAALAALSIIPLWFMRKAETLG
jgi:MFS family permease